MASAIDLIKRAASKGFEFLTSQPSQPSTLGGADLSTTTKIAGFEMTEDDKHLADIAKVYNGLKAEAGKGFGPSLIQGIKDIGSSFVESFVPVLPGLIENRNKGMSWKDAHSSAIASIKTEKKEAKESSIAEITPAIKEQHPEWTDDEVRGVAKSIALIKSGKVARVGFAAIAGMQIVNSAGQVALATNVLIKNARTAKTGAAFTAKLSKSSGLNKVALDTQFRDFGFTSTHNFWSLVKTGRGTGIVPGVTTKAMLIPQLPQATGLGFQRPIVTLSGSQARQLALGSAPVNISNFTAKTIATKLTPGIIDMGYSANEAIVIAEDIASKSVIAMEGRISDVAKSRLFVDTVSKELLAIKAPGPTGPVALTNQEKLSLARLNKAIVEAKPITKVGSKAKRAKLIGALEDPNVKLLKKLGEKDPTDTIGPLLERGELLIEKGARFQFKSPVITKVEKDNLLQQIKDSKVLTASQKSVARSAMFDILDGQIPPKTSLSALEEVFGSGLVKSVLSKRPGTISTTVSAVKKEGSIKELSGSQLWEDAINIGGIPRTVMTTLDFSGLLRQAGPQLTRHPFLTTKAAIKAVEFAIKPGVFDKYFEEIKLDPLYPLMKKSGLAITDPSSAVIGGREEAFISRTIQDKLKTLGAPVRFSERLYVGLLNKIRIDVFKQVANAQISAGVDPTSLNSLPIFEALANVVNNFTGRGKLPGKWLEKSAAELSTVFFAPRLVAARVNALNPIWYAKMYMKPATRPAAKEAIYTMVSFVIAGITILKLILAYKKAFDIPDDELSVETNPRSSDFGKVKMGNTRFDIWGGHQQIAVFVARMATGETKSTTSGEVRKLGKEEFPFETRLDVAGRLARSKLAPIPGQLVKWIDGAETFEGEPLTITKSTKDIMIPLIIQDIIDAYQDAGSGSAFQVGLAAFFGIGTSTYAPRKKKGLLDLDLDLDLNLDLDLDL